MSIAKFERLAAAMPPYLADLSDDPGIAVRSSANRVRVDCDYLAKLSRVSVTQGLGRFSITERASRTVICQAPSVLLITGTVARHATCHRGARAPSGMQSLRRPR